MKIPTRIALIQLSSNDKPEENCKQIEQYLNESIKMNPRFILTPEVSNFISTNRNLRKSFLTIETKDPTLKLVRKFSLSKKIWVLIGSLALKFNEKVNDYYLNRSLLINPNGEIVARYDKIHMFDIRLNEKVSFKESKYYRPGNKAVLVKTSFAKIGMTICYDLRFPKLYRNLASAGANIICVPSAFTIQTGKYHWETLLRARALENNVHIIAPAQCGQNIPGRRTWGHSLIISPEGQIISDSGENPGISIVDLQI